MAKILHSTFKRPKIIMGIMREHNVITHNDIPQHKFEMRIFITRYNTYRYIILVS